MADELYLRAAVSEDIPVLVRHRRNMAESIARERGLMVPEASGWDIGGRGYACYLQAGFASGTIAAWVVECTGRIVASGAVSLLPWPPGWGDGGEVRIGLLHSVWTDDGFRRRGCGQRIVQAGIDWCRVNKIRRLDLGASDAGRPLYEQMGFKASATVMHLFLR